MSIVSPFDDSGVMLMQNERYFILPVKIMCYCARLTDACEQFGYSKNYIVQIKSILFYNHLYLHEINKTVIIK